MSNEIISLALTAIGMAGDLPWSDFAPERDYILAKWAEAQAPGPSTEEPVVEEPVTEEPSL